MSTDSAISVLRHLRLSVVLFLLIGTTATAQGLGTLVVEAVDFANNVDDIKRAVLIRLMTDIQTNPQRVNAESGLNNAELDEIFVLLSNARHFVNDNVIANTRKMCASWKRSHLQDQARVEAAVEAYNASVKQNKLYINRHYRMVLLQIENYINETSWRSLNAYLNDRNTRLSRDRSLSASLELHISQENAESLHARCGLM